MPGGTSTFSYLTLSKSRDEALLRSAHHSTSIEGNPRSPEEAAGLIEDREMIAVLAEGAIRSAICWSARRTPLAALSERRVSAGVLAESARPFEGAAGKPGVCRHSMWKKLRAA